MIAGDPESRSGRNDVFMDEIPPTLRFVGTDANRQCEREQSANMFGICRAARRIPIGKLRAIKLAWIAEVRRRRTKSMTWRL